MIKVQNLVKKYGYLEAIKSLNFEIEKGEIIGFLGPNGAGKTTTMKIITCFMPPTSGEVTIGDLSILNDSYEIRQKIGYLPEDNPLYLEMTTAEYLRFCGDIRRLDNIKYRQDRVVNLCQLKGVLHQPIDELSKGYRQRVGLAQALLHEPELLILDEPTSGLDPTQIIEIRELIKTLGSETTIIMCSHILSEVSATCSRVFILNKGQIVADGTPKELSSKSKGEAITYVEINQNLETLKDPIQTKYL